MRRTPLKIKFSLAALVAIFGLIVMGSVSSASPAKAGFPISLRNVSFAPRLQATALATYAATDDGGGIDINPRTTTPTATVPPLGTPGGGFNNNGTPIPAPTRTTKFEVPPTLDDLLKQFPDLKAYIDPNLKIDSIDLGELYKKLVIIYNEKGATGLAVFLKDSGLLDKFNLPVSYLDLLMVFDKEGLEGVNKLAKARGYINAKNEVVAYVTPANVSDVDQIIADLTKLGVSTYPPLNAFGQLEIGIPIEVLSAYQTPGTLIKYLVSVATVKNVAAIDAPIPKSTTDKLTPETVANFIGQGGKFVGVEAWHKAGITGKGVRVGVLDLGFGRIKELMNGKDLPKTIKTAQDIDELNEMEEVHGTACTQIVFSAAPDAEIFVGMADTDDNYNDSINFFIKNKVQIITYSVGGTVGPRDGTFGEALVVDEIVEKTGVLWLTAAGNEATSHSLFKFSDKDADGANDFGNQEQAMPFIAFDTATRVVMNWNGSWKGSEKNEFTFTIFDENGEEVATAAEPKKGRKNDFPFQTVKFRSTPESKYFLVVRRSSKTKADATIDLFINNALFPEWAQISERSVTVPGDSNSSLTVGATGLTKDKIEDYSSQGPTMDGRIKPDVTAPTGEKIAAYPKGFYGTSGATPLTAGVAALYFQAFPGISASEVRAAIQKNVVDLGKKGVDPIFGNGRIKLPDPATINKDNGPDPDVTPEPGGDPDADPTATLPAGKVTPTKAPTKKPAPTKVAAEITDTQVKFNVTSKGTKGIQVSVSFKIDGFKGKSGLVAVIFGQDGGKTVVKPKTDKYSIGGTLGTSSPFTSKFDSAEFENVPLFLPNSEFGNLPKGDNELVYIVAIVDPSKSGEDAIIVASDPADVTVSKK
jgi:hypothetical protein